MARISNSVLVHLAYICMPLNVHTNTCVRACIGEYKV